MESLLIVVGLMFIAALTHIQQQENQNETGRKD